MENKESIMSKQRLINIIGGLMVLFAVLPLLLNAGTIALLALGLLLLSTNYWSATWRKRLMPFIALGLIACLLYAILILSFAHLRQPPAELQGETVIVLGCKVNGDRPSLMLQRRLDTAVAYLRENPDARCIVSGGQGDNETRTEASVMGDYLEAQGIEPSRIFREEQSRDTKENLLFSRSILLSEGLEEPVVIISDGFHQFRAWLIANKLELDSFAVSANTRFWLVPAYAVREVLSLIKLLPFLLS